MAEPWRERVEIGPCVLYLADCLQMLAAGAIPADAGICTDPPYGIGYEHSGGGHCWAAAKLGQRKGAESRIINDDRPWDPRPWLAHAAIGQQRRSNHQSRAAPRIAMMGVDHWGQHIPVGVGSMFYWDKSCGMGPADSFVDGEFGWRGNRNARNCHRQVWKGRIRCGDDRAPGGRLMKRRHVAEKPVGLMRFMMDTARFPVDGIVCDPYMGSGTTGVACLQTGRRFLGIEIAEEHYRVAVDRITRAWTEISEAAP